MNSNRTVLFLKEKNCSDARGPGVHALFGVIGGNTAQCEYWDANGIGGTA